MYCIAYYFTLRYSLYVPVMAQAQITQCLGHMLISHRNLLLQRLHRKDVLQKHELSQLMYSVLYFLNRILERDLPQLTHSDSTCVCKEAIFICFYWIIPLETLVSKRLVSFHTLPTMDSSNCWLKQQLVKYRAICAYSKRLNK